ncbi:cytochrome P450 [Colletotrichum graminicola]|uniref:Cytochrome P450 n=1 Tax=Colletotrichum graminicola (strain M1.001 / M2 / FGSC 10212) TaxID=645133 RepID=E3QWU5_COLGM|nr:cytochrome P450 [Colletotrichum graminicola M1.001]EFQ35333.1 cytochrome P450 [Colletotrichum graminicola M1.001]WDK22084.1 cytochrome P450 [Colletotrichum graminicola]
MQLVSLMWHPGLLAVAAGAAAVVAVVYFLTAWALSTRRPRDFPPGPPPVMIMGNALQLPTEKAFLGFREWEKTYGNIMGFKVGANNYVVISDAEHVRELFEKRGALYSDRQQPYITAKLVNPESLLFMNNDHRIKKMRTGLRHLFKPVDLRRILTVQAAQAALLMRDILNDPENLQSHLRGWALATPRSIIGGQGVAESGVGSTEYYFEVQETWVKFLTPARAPPVDIFPAMKYIPTFLASWKREAATLHSATMKIMYHMLDGAKIQHAKIIQGTKSTENMSLMVQLLGEESKDLEFRDNEIASLCSTAVDGAVDTVFSTVGIMILVMGAYPEAQKRVQAEVDSIWQGEAPEPDGLHKAKYLSACLTEVMRWRPVTPLGFPRVLARDDTYCGFKFPKGTSFILNAWSIHMDDEWYDKPEEFRPERYLENEWGVKPLMRDAAEAQNRHPTYGFGAGRRMCPGSNYAENQIMITIAKLMWEFDVVAKGNLDTSIETGYHDGLILGTAPFKVDIVPRSEDRKRAILEDSSRAEKVVAAWTS